MPAIINFDGDGHENFKCFTEMTAQFVVIFQSQLIDFLCLGVKDTTWDLPTLSGVSLGDDDGEVQLFNLGTPSS